ncbi:MAG: c-type cytochrome [Actinobacteria bacterium]|nr:c-type cytochrome [Actinomycetota bacterium]
MTLLRAILRRRPAAVHATLAVTVAAVVWSLGAGASGGRPAAPTQAADPGRARLIQQGRDLYVPGCSACHGLNGQGVVGPDGRRRGVSLIGRGEASAYYVLTTGRMPLADSEGRTVRKPPAYPPSEIRALVAYVGTLGGGPKVPAVDAAKGDLAQGGELFRANCQACHSATGAGGALSYGRAAPTLMKSTPTQIGAAVRIGPGQMPAFGSRTLSPQEVDSVARYVQYLQKPEDRGGLPLGRLGPIPEGMLVWVGGLGSLLLVCLWIGSRMHTRHQPVEDVT